MKRLLAIVLALFGCACLHAESPRIVGGSAAPSGAYPWMVGLLDKSTQNLATAQDCGGALIHPYWVMTAAHCVLGLKAADMQVVVGATDLNATGLTRIDVLEIVVHPQHLPTGYDYDVALLLLAQPVTNVEPLEIIDDPALVQPGVMATALGWGIVDPDDVAGTPILQQVQVPIVDQAIANDSDHLAGEVTENMLAAGFEEGGADSCSGDSGGPLVIRGRNGQWVQAGIVSWGLGCADPKSPGVYTRISKMRQWVQSIVWPNFSAWETAAGITTDDGPDVDRDGATQWTEYALRRNPLSVVEATGFPKAGVELSGGHLYPTLTVHRPLGGGDVIWGLQGTTSLSAWTTLAPATQQSGVVAAVPGDAGAESITWRGLEGVSGRSFLRAVIKPGGSYVNARRSLAFPGGVIHALHSLDTLTGGFRSRDYLLTNLPLGQSVTLTLRSDAFDPVLKLLNADTGVVIDTSSSNTASGNDEKIIFTPSSGVRYSAQVTTQAAGGVGEFTLSVFQPPAGLTTISGSQSISGSLAVTDPRDSFYPDVLYYSDDYLFTVTAASPVMVLMTSNSYDPAFSIINAETRQLLFAGTGREDNAAALQAFLPRPGVPYIIRASSNLSEETGNYTLKTSAVTTIATGDQKTGSLTSVSDGVDPDAAPAAYYYTDVFAFTLSSSAAVSVFMSSSAFDSAFSMIDSRTSRIIGSGYGVDTDGIAMQTFVPVAGVTYFVRASTYAESVLGNYSLKILATPAVTTGATINQQFSSSDGVDPYYAPEGAYYADDYILSGAVAGTPRTVTVTSGTVNVTVEVLDAGSGETVAYNDDSAQGVTNASTTFTPKAGRSYIVRVSEFDELVTGTYVLKVQ